MKVVRNNSNLDDNTIDVSNKSSINASNRSTESNNSSNNKTEPKVSFSNLEIRCYNVTIGDAPTSNGPPVSLSWEYDPNATEGHQIDHYEHYRNKIAPRRDKKEMLLPSAIRQNKLMTEMGYSRGEIREATEEAKRCAKQREKTVKRLGLQPVEEALEKIQRFFSFGKRNRQREMESVWIAAGGGGVGEDQEEVFFLEEESSP